MITNQTILCHKQECLKERTLHLCYFPYTLITFLVHTNVNPVTVTDEITGTYLKIFLLLYANNTIIIANDSEKYCEKWKFTTNIDKTKIMVFNGIFENTMER